VPSGITWSTRNLRITEPLAAEGLAEVGKALPRYYVMVTTLLALTGEYPLSVHVAVIVYVLAAQALPHG
jgi:hypothetical protein